MAEDAIAAKYLRVHAEPVIEAASYLAKEVYDAACVVPVYDEPVEAISRLATAEAPAGRYLFIIVVNEPTTAEPPARDRNQQVLAAARGWGRAKQLTSEVMHVVAPQGSQSADVLLVDATSGRYRLREKEGVGRARKMGFDLALSLFQKGSLRGSYVGSTDADVELGAGYFGSLKEAGERWCEGSLPAYSALLYPYEHRPAHDLLLREAMLLVELTFRYYVLGLAHAGSPYAYHSLGSALAVSLPHYARVRGVPNRQAGEDFYLLSKLSKLGPLRRVGGPVLSIETRVSGRVPFGTGPSLQKALDQDHAVSGYHPDAFVFLKAFLDEVVRAARSGDNVNARAFQSECPAWVSRYAAEFFDETRPHLNGCPTGDHRVRRVHERFDALSSLKFIHRAHREGLSPLPITQAIGLAPFVNAPKDAESMLRWCVEQERALSNIVGLPAA